MDDLEFLMEMLKDWGDDHTLNLCAPCGCKVSSKEFGGDTYPLVTPCDNHRDALLAATTPLGLHTTGTHDKKYLN